MRSHVTAAILAIVVLACGPAGAQTVKDQVGFTDLVNRLGGATPTGAGVQVSQIEALFLGGYLPDPNNSDFKNPDKNFTDMTGAGGLSSHATMVGRDFYGKTVSIAPGILDIHNYEAGDFLGSGQLNALSTVLPPLVETSRVQNHSWIEYDIGPIGPFSSSEVATDILRRFDMMIARDGVVAVVGIDNPTASPIPQLMANSYNSIAVSVTSNSIGGRGPTTLDVVGRSKPDITTPLGVTSDATPWVAAGAALLVEAATTLGDADAQRPETIKAFLLGGATKDEIPTWSHTPTQPLDIRAGAGEMNINNSFLILEAGQQEASDSSLVNTIGWDVDTIGASETNHYFFDIQAGTVAETLSVIATWNREIAFTPGAPKATLTPTVADIDLRLMRANGFSIGPLVAESISAIDNVEHVFGLDLAAGRYVLEVTSDISQDFSITWSASIIPEPSSLVLTAAVGLALGAFGYRRYRRAAQPAPVMNSDSG